MYKLKFIFSKKGTMRYISHLDLMRLFMRAMRRANLPLEYTCGFNPHPKLSIKRALKLGLESDNEEASIVLRDEVDNEDFKQRFQQQLPQGIEIKSVDVIDEITG
jgi:radical SAM-linked protein